jgi:acyl-coenzyme A thioesterase PaaI-like protein
VADWAIVVLCGKFGFTAKFSGQLLRPVRIGQALEARAKILKDNRRIVDVGVEITQNGEVAYAGEFRFVVLDRSGAERLLQRPLPDTWQRFCR